MNEQPWTQPIYRNRHGRGLRRPVFTSLPHDRTSSGLFDAMVSAQVSRLKRAWPHLLNTIEFAVEDVPPSDPLAWEEYKVVLSQNFPARHGIPARIALYRRPIEFRASTRTDMQIIIRYEIVAQLADLYGMSPRSIDPSWSDKN